MPARSKFLLSFLIALISATSSKTIASPNDSTLIKISDSIFEEALTNGRAYEMLRVLTKDIGARLSGSPEAAAAVEWGRQEMERQGLENVRLQEIMVPHWIRGEQESAMIVGSKLVGNAPLTIAALGSSVGTPELGLTAEVVMVKSMQELRDLGEAAKGKIVFFNRAMDVTLGSTFSAYGGAVGQRGGGAVEAAKAGGVAALVRSMAIGLDDFPHTGNMRYAEGVEKIPAAAISTQDAEFLAKVLAQEKNVRVNLRLSCETLPDKPSANVLGELRGSVRPEEVVVIGGHLDSWDLGEGAHDDGSGCVQSIEALRILKTLGLRPKRTIRAVLFMNEENGLRGGREYAKAALENGEKHFAAIESDRGGFPPRGFGAGVADDAMFEKISSWNPLFSKFGPTHIIRGGGGADIGPLRPQGTMTLGLLVDDHRYFDYHHSANDTFDKVSKRELELGAAFMALMGYLLANEGL